MKAKYKAGMMIEYVLTSDKDIVGDDIATTTDTIKGVVHTEEGISYAMTNCLRWVMEKEIIAAYKRVETKTRTAKTPTGKRPRRRSATTETTVN